MNIYYFNPDNDLALASGVEHYTPTPMAEQLRLDLQLLPCWIASPGDYVLCDSHKWQSWVDAHGFGVRLITKEELSNVHEATFRPWGWNPAMRWRLARWGTDERLLPSKSHIMLLRKLAHRRTTIAIHNRISEITGKVFCSIPVELDNMDRISDFAHRYPGCYAKEPWSGSGRGIYRALNPQGRDFIQRCQGALTRQGSMLCEVPFERTLDFAIEMESSNQHTSIIGYSIFKSDFHLQYKYGIVKPEMELRDIITMQYPDYHIVEDAIIKVINELISPHYNGFLGVDMLLFRNSDGTIGINPCVELNLRTTMGTVTSILGEQHGLQGVFSIIPAEDIKNDDIALIPVDDNTRMIAVVRR